MGINTDAAESASSARLRRRLPLTWLAAATLVVIVVVFAAWLLQHRRPAVSPVPQQVQKAVNFPIYYPQPSQLPAGYSLDTTSFHMQDAGVVIYSVEYAGQRLIFSEQAQPDHATIDKFTKTYIPLHTSLKTSVGEAQVGAFGSGNNLRTVVSLPITRGPWLILTIPPGSNHADLTQVLKALSK